MVVEYTRLGEVRFMRDQNGTEHTYAYDDAGRLTVDEVTTFGNSDIDDLIDAITTTYDDFGRVEYVRSYSDYGGGSEAIENAALFEYTDLWQVAKVWQDPDGDVVTAGGGASPVTAYAWETEPFDDASGGPNNFSRVSTITNASERYIEYTYGSSGSIDDRISRVTTISYDVVTNADVIYDYIGLSMVAQVDYAEPDVQLDFTARHNGERNTQGNTDTAGEYPGYDRFGRAVRQTWVDGGFTTHASDTTVPNVPSIVELLYTWDEAGNVLSAHDGRENAATASQQKLSHEYLLDGLYRLTEAERGQAAGGGAVTQSTGSQMWGVDVLGNFNSIDTDLDGDGTYDDTDEEEDRSHSADELDVRSLIGQASGGGDEDLDLTHDENGNVVVQELPTEGVSSELTYVYDAWDRLVRVDQHEVQGGGRPDIDTEWLENEYNGLSWRTVRRRATTVGGTLDEEVQFYYDASWRILEERIYEDWSSGTPGIVDRKRNYVWGLRYLDDLCFQRDEVGQGIIYNGEEINYYHLTDLQFSTVCLIDDVGGVMERVTYDAYGKANHRWRADLDGDGDQDAADEAAVYDLSKFGGTPIEDAAYEPDADLDRDGDVDDYNITGGDGNQAKLPPGTLSQAGVDNIVGFSGYVYNDAPTGWSASGSSVGVYTVRFRHYDTGAMRWLTRDPAGYVDGANLYGYVRGNPIGALDPYGLETRLERLRRLIMEREGWRYWPVDEHGRKWVIHHIKYISEGGTDDLDNLVAMPRDEHIRLHRERGDFKRWGKKGAKSRAKKAKATRAIKGIGYGAIGIIAFLNIAAAPGQGSELAKEVMIKFQQLSNTSDYWVAYGIAWDITLLIADKASALGIDNVDDIMEAWGKYRDWLRDNPREQRGRPADDPANELHSDWGPDGPPEQESFGARCRPADRPTWSLGFGWEPSI